MIRKILLIALTLLLTQYALSQEWEFGPVQKLSSAINSEVEESFPLLSPDGKTLYFTRFMHSENAGGKFAGPDIWVSKFNGTGWSKAINATALNNKNNNAIIGVNADGKVLYLLNASSSKELKTISFSRMMNGNFTKPELIPIDGLDHQGFIGFYVSPDFEVILLSMRGADSKGEEDIYVCVKNQLGQWMRPKNLGTAINTAGFEISPFLSPDKKRLYFSSNGHTGLGDADIFYSERLYNSWETWTIPKNLGNRINSNRFDAYFSVYDNVVYFASNRNSEFSDLYTATVKKTIDSTQQQVKKIVEEARSILGDLGAQSMAPDEDSKSFFIEFDVNSFEIDSKAARQLNRIMDLINGKNLDSILLSTYSTGNSSEHGNSELVTRRMQAVQNYLIQAGIPYQKIAIVAKNSVKRSPDRKNGVHLQYALSK